MSRFVATFTITTFGADLDFRLTPTNQVQLLLLRSNTQYPTDIQADFDQPSGSNDDHLVSFEYDHHTRTWGWWADYEEAEANFRADLGYYPRVGYRNVEGGILHTWNGEPDSWWSTIRAGGEFRYLGERDGGLLERGGSVWANYHGTMQSYVHLRAWPSREAYVDQEFDLTGGLIEGGFWPAGDLQVGASVIVGDQIDYANARLGSRFAEGHGAHSWRFSVRAPATPSPGKRASPTALSVADPPAWANASHGW